MKLKLLLAGIAVVVAGTLYLRLPPAEPKISQQLHPGAAGATPSSASSSLAPPSTPVVLPDDPVSLAPPISAASPSVREPVSPPPLPSPARTAIGNPATKAPSKPKPDPLAPAARAALSYVGEDEIAEEIWHEAINNPAIPPHERQDLIEDLNEDGFPNPHHVTLDDLPLILSRLALIEQVAPDAMDEVNADAFAEAYKDLANMLDRLAQQ